MNSTFSYSLDDSFPSNFNSDFNTDFGLTVTETVILILYCVILIIGILANAGLAIMVCGGHSGNRASGRGSGASGRPRSRSPILLGLCAADLLVCSMSAPLTVCFAVLATKPWPFEVTWCKVAFFLQALPVAVSTLSLMLVSLDRYFTVRYPRPLLRLSNSGIFSHIYTIAAVGAWVIGFLVMCPIIYVRCIPQWTGGRCVETWSSTEMRRCYVLCRVVVIHMIPCAMVMACHLGVKGKLTALSLTARAAHGELPLPVPLLRRPAHVIIVAALTNNADGKVRTYNPEGEPSTDAGEMVDKIRSCYITRSNSNRHKQQPMGHSGRKRKRSSPYARRATRTEQEIRQDHRRLRPHHDAPLPNSPQRPSSTLRSRRRLANALVSAAAVFVGCWLPHVVCTVCAELCAFPNGQQKQLTLYSLLIGHAHSAINPIVYWALNNQSLHSSCNCFARLRFPHTYKNASSTNEAALGPFNPKFTKPTNTYRQPMRRHSSCYLY